MYDYQCGSMPPSAHRPSRTFTARLAITLPSARATLSPLLSCVACVSYHRVCAPQRLQASDGACSPLTPRSHTLSRTPSLTPSPTPSRMPSRTPSPMPSPTLSPTPSRTPSRMRPRTRCQRPRRPTASSASARCARSSRRRRRTPPSGSSSCAPFFPARPLLSAALRRTVTALLACLCQALCIGPRPALDRLTGQELRG